MSIDDIRFSQTRTFGDHLYRREGEKAEIIFKNTRTGIRKTIVDDAGRIIGFPGIAHPELVSSYYKRCLGDRIRFSSYISLLDGQYALIWQIQAVIGRMMMGLAALQMTRFICTPISMKPETS